jgi:hypothetical protein
LRFIKPEVEATAIPAWGAHVEAAHLHDKTGEQE